MTQTPAFYPGNRDLPVEVRERILNTFRQSVQLLKHGHPDQAASGCDLILKMDPAFVPARKLLEKVQNPDAPVDVDALLLSFDGGSASPSATVLVNEARTALDARDFPRAIELANQVLRSDLTNQQAQDIGREAQERLEAAPFVAQFLQKARNHAAGGNISGARSDLEKARSLDPGHPDIRQLENALASSPASAPAPPPRTAPAPPPPAPMPPAADQPFNLDSSTPFSFDFQPETPKPAPESSFIVDSPPPGRSSQASDFGFSFEEDQGGSGFVFDSPAGAAETPPAQPIVGEAQTFDFSTANIETSPEDQNRIAQFLREGDEAHAAGDYQRATEIWSRIFLLDVTNHEAAERIERARKQQQDVDAQTDQAEREAIVAFEAGDLESARARFEEIQRLHPGNTTATEYLARMSAPGGTGIVDFEPPPVRNEQDLAAAYGIPLETDLADYESSTQHPPLIPPDNAVDPRASRTTAATPKPTRRKGGVLLLAAALVALLAAGYFGFRTFFSGGDETVDSQQTEVTLNRAQALAAAGKYDQAMTLLGTIKPGDPLHDRALALMGEYRNKKTTAPVLIDGRPADEVFNELVARGQTAFTAQDFLTAKEALEKASAIRPLSPEVTQMYTAARQQVAKLESALVLFKEGNYNGAIAVLDALKQQDPNNQSIQRLLNDAHFNLGAIALRDERLEEAAAQFESVLAANPNDDLARRSRDIAARYQDQPRDLLFQIYVKYLPLR